MQVAQKPWSGHPPCGRPADYLPPGTWVSGLLPPGSGGTHEAAATQKTDLVTQGTDSELLGRQPKEKATQLPQQRGTLETAGEGRGHQCTRREEPKDHSVREEGTQEPWRRGATGCSMLSRQLQFGLLEWGTNPKTNIVFRCSGTLDLSLADRVIIVLGLRFALPEALRRLFLRAVAAAVFYVLVAAATSASCRGTKPAEHRIPHDSATPDVEASSITSWHGRRVLLSERRCGVTVCLQSRRRQPVLHLSQVSSSVVTSALRSNASWLRSFGWRRFRFTWHQVSVLFSPGGRAEPRPWHQTFCPVTSERLHSRQQVSKHSAATAGQLSSGTGGEFLVDQRRIFGNSNRENFTDTFFHSVAFNRKFPHQAPTIQTVQKSGEASQCCILFGIDVPEERQRQVPTNQIIQRTVERTQVRVHRDVCRSSRRPEDC